MARLVGGWEVPLGEGEAGPLEPLEPWQEDRTGGGRRYLHHESEDEDHRNAGHDVGVILNDELMAEYRRVLVGALPALDSDHLTERSPGRPSRSQKSIPECGGAEPGGLGKRHRQPTMEE
jgi:hypothetical protein